MLRTYLRFVLQSVLGMLGLSVYILADTFFIANYIGADALAALNLALPVYGIINGTGLLIGIGGATRYTICRTRKSESGSSAFSGSLLLAAAAALIFVCAGLLFPDAIARLLGASGGVLEPTTVYLQVCCLFSPLFLLNNILVAFTRNDDAPGRGMAAMLIGSFANIVMDWYLVCIAGMGMFGAVLATGMSPVFGITVCLCRRRGYRPARTGIFAEIPRIFGAGFSAFVGELSSTVVILVFNYLLLALSGNTAVAAYGIIANVALVATAMLTGAAQGAQPLFSRGDAALTALAVPGLTLYFTNYLFSGVSLLFTARLAATERAKPAALLSLLRGVVLVVPCALLGAALGGVTGLWLAVPAAELLTLIAGLLLLRREAR